MGIVTDCKVSEYPPGWRPWFETFVPDRVPGVLAVDVTAVLREDFRTGISRVVRRTVESGLPMQNGPLRLMPVSMPWEEMQDVRGVFRGDCVDAVAVQGFDKLLLLDATWDLLPAFGRFAKTCSDQGIAIIGCVHDLIPLDHPETCPGNMTLVFRRWLSGLVASADRVVCVSESTAWRLASFLGENRHLPSRIKGIGWWRLGADFRGQSGVVPTEEMRTAPTVLCVGAFEPRKNVPFVLEAFTRWWRDRAYPVHLILAGRSGWGIDAWKDGLKSHSEYRRKLWVVESPDDAELDVLYRRASAIVMPSIAEGFGLPVVEGASFGKPVVLSDIPVFREIVRANGYFFQLGDRESLRDAIDDAVAPGARPTQTWATTWAESTRELLRMIDQDDYQIRIRGEGQRE